MIEPFIAALTIALVSFAGLLFISTNAKDWLFKHINLLVTFAAGVFLMSAFNLAAEAFELMDHGLALTSIAAGFIILWIIQSLIPETHHHHDTDCASCEQKPHKGVKILIGDAIHNIGDGILLVPTFLISFELGLILAVSIFIHEFIQEISEFFVLKQAGFSTKKALFWNFISALTIVLGVCIGVFLAQSITLQAILIGISAGMFLHIVFHDLLPYQVFKQKNVPQTTKHIIVFILGTLLIMFIGLFTPHSHEHDSNDHGSHDYDHETELHDEHSDEDDHYEHEEHEENDHENEEHDEDEHIS